MPRGTHRYCKVCGGFHDKSKPWPHNCRPEANWARSDLASPGIIHDIEPYQSLSTRDRPVIGSRSQERVYMKDNGLVHYHGDGVDTLPDKEMEPPGDIERDMVDAWDQLEAGYHGEEPDTYFE